MYERIETDDGSYTYLNTTIGATYRSAYGAATESRYIFLEGTRLEHRRSPWRVLELGFGTGLNFHITHQAALAANVELEYVALESEPMPSELWLVDNSWKSLILGERMCRDGIGLTVVEKRWQDYQPPEGDFHAVYHDPFGPGAAPECWDTPCFEWSYRAIARDGVLATFGASTSARQAMKDAGFFVGSLRGAPGKREMTVASPSADFISYARPWKRKSRTEGSEVARKNSRE